MTKPSINDVESFLREQQFDDDSIAVVSRDMIEARFGEGSWAERESQDSIYIYAIRKVR